VRLAVVGGDPRGSAQLAGGAMGAKDIAGCGLRVRRHGCVIRQDVGLDVPLEALAWGARREAPLASGALMCRPMRGRQAVLLPARGQGGEGLLSGFGGANALGLQETARRGDGRVFTLGHPSVVQRPRRRAGMVSQRLPGIARERVPHDRRNHREGGWHTSDHAQPGTMGGLGDERPWARRVRERTPQRRSPLLEHWGGGGEAIPALAHTGAAPALSHQPFPHRLLQVRPGGFRVAVGTVHGGLITVREGCARARTAGRIAMMAALVNAVLDTDGAGPCTPQQVTPIRLDLRPPERLRRHGDHRSQARPPRFAAAVAIVFVRITPVASSMRDGRGIMAPVSPMAAADTSARERRRTPNKREWSQRPGSHIEPSLLCTEQ
jgi:hypothetical protein